MRRLKATAAVLERAQRSATIDEEVRLGIPPAPEVLELVRLRGMNSTPICVDTNVIPMTFAEPLLAADLTDQSLYETLETLCSVSIHRSAYSVQATAAPADIATLLTISPREPRSYRTRDRIRSSRTARPDRQQHLPRRRVSVRGRSLPGDMTRG